MKAHFLLFISIATCFTFCFLPVPANAFENRILNKPADIPGVELLSNPAPIERRLKIYLDVDNEGSVYRLNLERGSGLGFSPNYDSVEKRVLSDMAQEFDVVLQDRATLHADQSISPAARSAGSCPLPSSFSIVGDSSGNAVGNFSVPSTARPAGTTTQWTVFDFFTTNYRNAGSHMPIALFHKDVMHGWGSFIGDNSGNQHGQACIPASGHTSQIQGWIQTALPAGPTWQSQAFIGPNSCGVDLFDGNVGFLPGVSFPRYRMEMQANDQFWVSYRIFEFRTSPWGWTDITGWKTTNVTSGNWTYSPLLFDNAAEGIFFGASNGVPNWSINISNAQCGWF